MREKSSKGVQQADVWGAADAIVAAGERPTIEKVRQKIGSGSPNTVSPMLDAWYKTLPARLGVAVAGPAPDAVGYNMPADVVAAARTLWDTARRDAHEAVRLATKAQREQLDLREQALNIAEAELQRRSGEFSSMKSSLEDALQRGNDTIAGLQRQLEGAQLRQAALEGQLEQQRTSIAEAQKRSEALRAEHATALAQKDETAAQAAHRYEANERRLLLEVDRAREETKLAVDKAGREAARASEAHIKISEARDLAVAGEKAQTQAMSMLERRIAELSSVNQSLATEAVTHGERLQELRGTLDKESASHEATRALLASALTISPKVKSLSGKRRQKGKDGGTA